MRTVRYYWCLASVALLLSCQYEFPEEVPEQPNPGQADFSKMVAVGNSLTAGYMDGALYNRGQDYSFASILAEQMKQAGGGDFNVPSINSENGFFSSGPGSIVLGRLVLTEDESTSPPQIFPAPIGLGDPVGPFDGDKSSLNNFGIPGLSMLTALLSQTGDPSSNMYNTYYGRIASNPGTSTVIEDAANALADGGTFFTFWLGSNDAMTYAVGGAANPELLTGEAAFKQNLDLALGRLLDASPEAKGVVITVPNLEALPFFTLIDPLAIHVPEAARGELGAGLASINAAIAGWNAGVNANPNIPDAMKQSYLRPTLSTNFDAYPLLIHDPALSDAEIPLPEGGTFQIPKIRNLTEEDGVKIPLLSQPLLGQGLGISPLSPLNEIQFDHAYLTGAEFEEIQARIGIFNGFLETLAAGHADRLLLVDINEFIGRLNAGTIAHGGVGLAPSIAPPNGAYSVDGLHSNARGNAFVANYIIDAINEKWQATIPKVNPNVYPGNDLPR